MTKLSTLQSKSSRSGARLRLEQKDLRITAHALSCFTGIVLKVLLRMQEKHTGNGRYSRFAKIRFTSPYRRNLEDEADFLPLLGRLYSETTYGLDFAHGRS